MKIVYMWGVDFSNVLKVHSADMNSVYILMPESESGFPCAAQADIKKMLGGNAISITYDQAEIARVLLDINADVVISMGWRRILGEKLLTQLQESLLINIHPAILPQYKGYHSEPYVIINAEKEHGITAHRLTPGLDEGGIIHQKRFPISNFSTTASIKMQAYDCMPEFVEELLSIIGRNQFEEVPQDAALTKIVAPKRCPGDSEIDPSKPLIELYNMIRACDDKSYPAFFYLDGQKVFISIRRANDAPREHYLEL